MRMVRNQGSKMRDLNATACKKLYEDVEWTSPNIIITLVLLSIVDVMVIIGNVLVIMAVYHTNKLRNVTNMFIVSLAVADLLVGLAVLPFSATWEVFKVWIFGDIWCSIWLALDVWMCTASILNLCAISLDRYLAVSKPVTYLQIMSPKRAKMLVAGVWVLSFVICFPPLVGWKDQRTYLMKNDVTTDLETGPFNSTTILIPIVPCPWICELTNDAGYVVYSALGSFFIPMLVMMFFYWRIYNEAVSTTKAINQGFRTTKSSKFIRSRDRFDEQRLTLRIHRGRSSIHNGAGAAAGGGGGGGAFNPTGNSPKSPESSRNASVKRDKIKISVSYPSTETLNTKCNTLERTPSKCSQMSVYYNTNGQTQSTTVTTTTTTTTTSTTPTTSRNTYLKVSGLNRIESCRRPSRRSSCESQLTGDEVSPPSNEDRPQRVMKMGRRNIKAQVKRFRMETKAAKTLGIIVGGFILCWFPFFTMYLIRPFIHTNINPTVFSILFWLGYCNSAINPCIYALFSKDFRFAFKTIICNCICKRNQNSLRRGSDGSQIASRNPSYQVAHHIEDSDPHSQSDSR